MDNSDFNKLFNSNVPHIIERIFLSLDYQTFKNCHQVCNAWNEVLSIESFQNKAEMLLSENNLKLCRASTEGNLYEVRRILSHGMVDFNSVLQWHIIENITRNSTTHMGTIYGHKDVLYLLLTVGANQTGEYCYTPISRSVIFGRREVVKVLLDHGADPTSALSMIIHSNRQIYDQETVKMITKTAIARDTGLRPVFGSGSGSSTHFWSLHRYVMYRAMGGRISNLYLGRGRRIKARSGMI